MKPGTRVVSHMWDMGEWEPDETFQSGASEGFLWIVPAPVAGRWTLREEDGSWWGDVTLTQRFQRVGGTLTLRGGTQPLLGAYVERRDVRLHVRRSVRRRTHACARRSTATRSRATSGS